MIAGTPIDEFLENLIKGPSAFFAVVFIASSGLHVWQNVKYRSWPFTWSLPVACLLMAAGFICREYIAFHDDPSQLASVVQGLFYSSTPTFMLPLCIYTVHLMKLRPSRVRIPAVWVFAVISAFNTSIFSLVPQGVVGYYNPNGSADTIAVGLSLIKASLFLQLAVNITAASILCFYTAEQSRKSHEGDARDSNLAMAGFSLSALALLVLVRNVFRTVQIFMPPLDPAWVDQTYFWVFEAVVMLAFTGVFHIMHPSRYLGAGPGCCKGRRVEEGDNNAALRNV